MHAAPLDYKLRRRRRWIWEDNKGVHIIGIGLFLTEHAPEKAACRQVIYLKSIENIKEIKDAQDALP